MMKTAKTLLVIFCAFTLMSVDCKRYNIDYPLSILMSKKWSPGSDDKDISTNPGYPASTSIYAPVQECDKDDTYLFQSNGLLTINYGKNRCASQPETKNVTYIFDGRNKKLIIDNVVYIIADIKNVQFKYYLPQQNGKDLIYLLQ